MRRKFDVMEFVNPDRVIMDRKLFQVLDDTTLPKEERKYALRHLMRSTNQKTINELIKRFR